MFTVIGLDIETTGLLAPEHRILEICLDVWRWHAPRHRERLTTITRRIDPKRAIDKKAQAVHGIALDMLKGAPDWETFAPRLKPYLDVADMFVAHNGDGFDFPFLGMELERVGLSLPDCKAFDTMIEGRWACHNGKAPNLRELCLATDVFYDPDIPHAADRDTKAMMDAFWTGVDLGFFKTSLVFPTVAEAA